jgi:hypothetical protein
MIHNDDIEMNVAADHAAPVAHGHGNAAPAAEELNNVHDVAPMTPPQVQLHNTEEDIIEIIQSVEHVSAMKELITSIVGNATDIIPRLHAYQINAARCNIMDVDGPNAGKRRCYLQVDINNPNAALDNAELTVISDDSVPDLNLPMETPSARRQKKGKNKVPSDVMSVRRSDRLAGIKAGFFDAKSAAAANDIGIPNGPAEDGTRGLLKAHDSMNMKTRKPKLVLRKARVVLGNTYL